MHPQVQIYTRHNYLSFKYMNSQRQMRMLHADYQMFLFVRTAFRSMHILSFHQKSRRYAQTTESADLCDSQRAYIHANSLMYKKLTSKKRLHITKASGKKMPRKGALKYGYTEKILLKNTVNQLQKQVSGLSFTSSYPFACRVGLSYKRQNLHHTPAGI